MKNKVSFRIIVLSLVCAVFSLILAAPASVVSAATVSTVIGKTSGTPSSFDSPKGMTASVKGVLYIADTYNNVIKKLMKDGSVAVFSGTGSFGHGNGKVARATWSEPEGLTMDSKGTIYVADTGSSLIRKISGGKVTTLPISGLKRPHDILLSGTTIYISDTGNNRVVRTSVNGGRVYVVASKLKTPLKLAMAGKTIYVAEQDRGTVIGINVLTGKQRTVLTGLTQPRAVVYFNGNLYVSAGPSGTKNELWRVKVKTGAVTRLFRINENELFNQTSDLVVVRVNGSDRLFQLQSGGSSVYSSTMNGKDLRIAAGKHRFEDETGVAGKTQLGRPEGLAVSPDGTTLYVTYAQGNKIASVDLHSLFSTALAGHLMDNYREGSGLAARFSDVNAMAMSPDGTTMYLADRNSQRIRSMLIANRTTAYITGAGIVNLIDPKDASGVINPNIKNGYQEGSPCADTYDRGVAGCAYFNRPAGLALTSDGKTLYIADTGNQRIRSVNVATGVTHFIAGSGAKKLQDGVGDAASFHEPFSVALSANNKTLYVADRGNHAIRSVTLASGNVTTLAGTGKAGYREGNFATARFSMPEFVTVGPDGNVYVAEAGTQRIRKLDLTAGITSLVSGSGQRGNQDGAALSASWNGPKGMVVVGNQLYVADFRNDVIRRIEL